jgi:hypothetical protein
MPLFGDYARHSYWINAHLASVLLTRIAPERIVTHTGPPWVEVTAHRVRQVTVDRADETTAIHLTAFQPRRTLDSTLRIDTSALLAGFPIRLAVPGIVRAVYAAPERVPIPFVQLCDGIAQIEPSTLSPHTIIAVEHSGHRQTPDRKWNS